MNETKVCSKCHQEKKTREDFYLCKGVWRLECKSCTVKRNMRYTKQRMSKNRSRSYYAIHKEKFAEYRETFRQKHPEYYKEYFRKKRDKTREGRILPDINP